ncbi:MAG: cation-transporting P-type ATPase [Bacteroidetes bacterium]|nr:cation-transporting P-type ATPase [Bacteroidota bacterium]
MIKGLSTLEANELLASHGYNELPSGKSKNIGRIAFEVIKEPMFVLLISCGVLYMILGDYKEGCILLSTIFIIIFITFYQHSSVLLHRRYNSSFYLSVLRLSSQILHGGIAILITSR